MTFHIKHDHDQCAKHHDRTITYNDKTQILRRHCGHVECEATEHLVDENEGMVSATPIEPGRPRPKSKTERSGVAFQSFDEGGLIFAQFLATKVKNDLVYDGIKWWYYDYDMHKWRREKGGPMACVIHLKLTELVYSIYQPLAEDPHNEPAFEVEGSQVLTFFRMILQFTRIQRAYPGK